MFFFYFITKSSQILEAYSKLSWMKQILLNFSGSSDDLFLFNVNPAVENNLSTGMLVAGIERTALATLYNFGQVAFLSSQYSKTSLLNTWQRYESFSKSKLIRLITFVEYLFANCVINPSFSWGAIDSGSPDSSSISFL